MKKLLFAAMAATCVGCMKDNGDHGRNNTSFDFATAQTLTLKIDYRLSGYDNRHMVEVYAQNPETAGESIEPAMRLVTDRNGRFEGSLRLPSNAGKIWLRATDPGMPSLAAVPVNGRTVAFDMNAPEVRSRATTPSGHAYPDDMLVLGDWNDLGKPGYLLAKATVPQTLADEVKAVFRPGADLTATHPELFTGNNKTIKVVSPTSIDMVFLGESSGYANVVGYYTYPTGNPPQSLSDIRRIIALPNASMLYSDGALTQGDRIRLRYWNDGAFSDEFPAGTTIGFFVIINGCTKEWNDKGNISGTSPNGTYYSDLDLVEGQQQRIALYYNTERKLTVAGIEDMGFGGAKDFANVLFYLKSEVEDAVMPMADPDPTPDPGPDPDDNYTTYEGTLIFEDLWPYRGDYDMNDVVVEYTCKVWRDLDNKVVRTEDTFRPVNNGAQIQSGFAYQYGVAASSIKSMEPDTEGSLLPAPANHNPIPWSAGSDGFETGQPLATVILFDDIRMAVNPSGPLKYTIKTELHTPVGIETFGFPPYNPFIVIAGDPADGRRRELHLAGYLPTAKAGTQWFGYGDDKSTAAKYYISHNNYTFSLCIPRHGFLLPAEGEPITRLYPQYERWAISKGAENKEWYLYPAH